MLNLKKGLALVLAAATAFTFAPVANLGQAVTANAATSTQEYKLTNWDFDLKDTGAPNSAASRTNGTLINNTITAGALATTPTNFTDDGKGAQGYDFSGLWITRQVTLDSNRYYKVNSVTGSIDEDNMYLVGKSNGLVKLSKLGGFYTTDSDGVSATNPNSTSPAKPTAYNLILRIKSNTTSTIEFADQNATNNTYDIVDFTIKAAGKDGASNDTKTAVFKWVSGQWVEADHENNAEVGTQYNLQLNNATDSNYAIGVKTGSTVKTWTGMNATVDKVQAESTSGNLTWTTPVANSAGLKANLKFGGTPDATVGAGPASYVVGNVGGKTGNVLNTGDNLFYVTASNANVNTISLTYTLKDTTPASNATTTSTDRLYYVVDRSDKAVDWIKWKSTKITDNFDSTWTKNANDTYTLNKSEELDPYIHTTADIVVKSESTSLRFVSSDATILSVTENYQNKYYKAHVEAKQAGTATLSIYVNGTANNKGKIYNIPVKVTANATDDFDVKDSENLKDKETKDTIYLDAIDQTAANKVTSTKLAIKSKGNLKITNVKSSDTSVATISDDLTVTSAAKIADLSSPKTAVISWESISAGHITGGKGQITIVVWAKPRAQFTVDPVVLDLGSAATRTKTLSTNPVHTNVVWTEDKNGDQDELGEDSDKVFTLTNGSVSGNTQTTATVVARSYGSGSVKALVTETATTRPTAVIVPVTVGAENKNVLSANPTSVLLTEGDTATVNVTSSQSKAVSVKVNKTDVATAVTGAAVSGVTPITVTAVKAGTTEIVVTSDGADTLTIPVVVVSKNAIENATPEKVTGLKVSNKKGAYVSVKWTSQGKNINYRVYKKVGNGKWVGKNVAGSKTTLSVKKGAKVQVKVKSYVKDSNGKTTWGPAATKAKTFKTDKK